MPKVSIIIPVYNAEKYLRECLDSVLEQTLEDIEVLCIDDCSTDSSWEILQEYTKNDTRVKVFQNSVNQGPSYTRNVGIDNASGEYVQFVDADDQIESDTLSALYSIAADNRLDLLKTLCSRQKKDLFRRSIANRLFLTGTDLFEKLLSEQYSGVGPCLLFLDRLFVEKHHLRFDTNLKDGEDVVFSFQAIIMAQRCMCVNVQKYKYIRRENSIGTGFLTDEKICSHIRILKGLMDSPLVDWSDSKCRKNVLAFLLNHYVNAVARLDKRLEIADTSQWEPDLQEIYHIFFSGRGFAESLIDKEKLSINSDAIRNASQIYVFGAGAAAQRLIQILYRSGVEIDGVIVTDPSKNRKSVYGYPVFSAGEISTKAGQPLILSAVTGTYDEIGTLLKKQGLNYVINVCP